MLVKGASVVASVGVVINESSRLLQLLALNKTLTNWSQNKKSILNILWLQQNGCFADDIFKSLFWKDDVLGFKFHKNLFPGI